MISKNLQQQLLGFSIFASLDESNLKSLFNIAEEVNIKKNQFLYKKSDQKKFVYFLISGSIKQSAIVGLDKEIIKDIVLAGSLLGENIFTNNKYQLEDAKALDESLLISIPVYFFERLVRTSSSFANAVMEIMMDRLSTLEKRIKDYVFVSAKDRVLSFLYKMGSLKGIKIGIEECLIQLNLSHREIGSITDTSRQTVARVLSELKRDNLIHFSPRMPSKILLRDMTWA